MTKSKEVIHRKLTKSKQITRFGHLISVYYHLFAFYNIEAFGEFDLFLTTNVEVGYSVTVQAKDGYGAGLL